ncbi:hypothetical protein LXL04_027009 [Taraxacum kok-saghyz]
MGASLCCMKPPPPPPLNRREPPCSTIVVVNSPEKVIAKTHKRGYKEKEVEEEQGEDGGVTTLKEWLVKSQNNDIGHLAMNPTKFQVVNTRSPELSSPEIQSTEFYTPRISFSLESVPEKLEKVEETDEDENRDNRGLRFTPILKRNPSGKAKKTVAFQDNDIFFFYSPQNTFCDN